MLWNRSSRKSAADVDKYLNSLLGRTGQGRRGWLLWSGSSGWSGPPGYLGNVSSGSVSISLPFLSFSPQSIQLDT